MQVFVKLRNEERVFTVNLLQEFVKTSTWTTVMSRSSFLKRTAPLITQILHPKSFISCHHTTIRLQLHAKYLYINI